MKTLFRKLLFLGAGWALFASCQSDEIKAVIKSPSDVNVTLTASSSTLVLDSTAATTTNALTLTWTAAKFGAEVSVNYTLQFDTTDFTHSTNVNLGNELTKSYTERELNDLVLLTYNFTPGVARTLNARIKADINPGIVESVFSNTVNLMITPYSEIPPPKYPVPDSLYIVGSATAGAWGNPVPTPTQHFTKMDDHTFGMIIQLTGGQEYLLLPKNGDWGHKYNPPNSGANPANDSFQPDAGGNNIPGPANTGLYKIIIDFVKGTWTVTSVASNPIPPNLYIVGDATAGQWSNPVPVPSQQFKQISNGEFQLVIDLTATKSYLFLPLNGDWGHKFGGTDKVGGTLLADGNVPGTNTPAPDVTGSYLVDVNFLTTTYSVVPH